MSEGRSFLIDTNIVIDLEGEQPVADEYAEFQRRSSVHGISLYVHEASRKDFGRDTDVARRKLTVSKFGKFPILEGVAPSPQAELDRVFGNANNDNDAVDVALLDAVRRGVVDFLVTQDAGIHRRARRAAIENRVFRIRDANDWLSATFEPTQVVLPYIKDGFCYNISPNDPILATLREDYPEFDEWFKRHQKRACWILDVGGETAGVLIRKETEPRGETDATLPGNRILKISTFKVKEEYRGEKFGEHLLKQVLWFAQKNAYDLVYVTAHEARQTILVDLLQQFGFQRTSTKATGEGVFEKTLGRGPVTGVGLPIQLAKMNYPRFVTDDPVRGFIVPIQPRWYQVLFPEDVGLQTELFSVGDRTPGNTIRKVYLCRAKVTVLNPGDVLLFYVSGETMLSRSIRSVGIVEGMHEASNASSLLRLTGRRSVYSEKQQLQMINARSTPVKVIDFLHAGHLSEPIPLERLVETKVLKSWPQSLVSVPAEQILNLDLLKKLGY